MEIFFENKTIKLNRTLSQLDEFVLDFTNFLKKHNIKYVIVSGYVAIVFGRSRVTEDIDLLVEKIDFKKFSGFWKGLIKSYYCLNTDVDRDAYFNYLRKDTAIRFSKKGKFIPNIEFKFVKSSIDGYVIKEPLKVIINNKEILISPLEMQIAYKMYLGSEKDLEDAKFIFDLFKEKIDLNKLKKFMSEFNIDKNIIKEYLGELS